MREYIYSLATLTGFIGLASLYQHGQNFSTPARIVKREADFSAINETDDSDSDFLNSSDLFQQDFDFLKELGYLDDDADVPEDMLDVVEDVKQYQATEEDEDYDEEEGVGPDARRASKNDMIKAVNKCMKSRKCRSKAEDTISAWGKDLRSWVLTNSEEYLRPVTTETRIDDSVLTICTPNDDTIPCNELSQDFLDTRQDGFTVSSTVATTGYPNEYVNPDPRAQFSVNPNVMARVEEYVAQGSDSLDALLQVPAGTVSNIGDENNVFNMDGSAGVKFFYVMPNGVPMHMSYNYKTTFANYWGWFTEFNDRYLGVGKNLAGRQNFMIWFIRQDRVPKPMSKNPAKARTFPISRMTTMMNRAQATAAQPQFLPTFAAIHDQVTTKNMGAAFNVGNDCVVIWVHHFVPSDIEALVDEDNQESIIKPLDDLCQIIHIWVGFNQFADDRAKSQLPAKDAIRYIQGVIQPSQLATTVEDPDFRGYHFINHVRDLRVDRNNVAATQGGRLLSTVYNQIAVDRYRTTCLFATNTVNFAEAIEAYAKTSRNVFEDLFYDLGYDGSTTPSAFGDYTTSEGEAQLEGEFVTPEALDLTTDWEMTSSAAEEEGTTQAVTDADGNEVTTAGGSEATDPNTTTELTTTAPLPDFKCCGRGFSGVAYDSSKSKCCNRDGIATVVEGFWCEESET